MVSSVIYSIIFSSVVLVNFSSTDAALTLNINSYVDKLLSTLKENAASIGLNPYHLQDATDKFHVGFIHGHVNVDNGKIWGVDTIARNGNAAFVLQSGTASVRANITFKDLKYEFNFKAKLGKVGPKGKVGGDLKDLYIDMAALADFRNTSDVTASLQQFTVTHAGSISLKLESGNKVLKVIVNAISKLVMKIFKNKIIHTLQNDVGKALNSTMNKVHFNLNG